MSVAKPRFLSRLRVVAASPSRHESRRTSEQAGSQPPLTASGFVQDSTSLTTGALSVGASPVSEEPQEVRVRYSAEHFFGGRWIGFELSPSMSAEVSGSRTARFGPWQAAKPLELGDAAGYRIVCKVSWYGLTSRRALSATSLIAARLGDNVRTTHALAGAVPQAPRYAFA